MNSFRLRSMVVLVVLGLWGGYVPMSRADEPALKLTTRAKIATIDPKTNQVKLRTEDDKPLTVIVDNQTKIRLNDREVAGGSLVVILVWVYYSSQIVLFGAEFAHVYANYRKSQSSRQQRQLVEATAG